MVWKVCFGICVAFLVAMVGFGGFLIFSKKRIKFPIAVFILLEFLGGSTLLFPIYWVALNEPFRTTLVSFASVLQIFTVNAGFDTMLNVGDQLEAISVSFKEAYYYVAALYYIIAPILTAVEANSALFSILRCFSSSFSSSALNSSFSFGTKNHHSSFFIVLLLYTP